MVAPPGEPLKPKSKLAPGAMLLFQATGPTVTVEPSTERTVTFQIESILGDRAPLRSNFSFQSEIAVVPLFLMTTLAPKPLPQSPVMVGVT